MNSKNKTFGVKIFNKGGNHYRKYTNDTLQMIYDISPSAANFELMIVIEGIVFISLRTHYIIIKKEQNYASFIKNKSLNSFRNAIKMNYDIGIFNDELYEDLTSYRELRNDIAHDLFQLKTFSTNGVTFKNEAYNDSLRELFKLGLTVFNKLGDIITPGVPSQEEYIKRFSGFYKKK